MIAFKPKDPHTACPYAMGRYQCWADLKTLAHPLRQGYGCKCNGTGNHDPGDEHLDTSVSRATLYAALPSRRAADRRVHR